MDSSQSIEEIEGRRWGDPEFPSHLIQTCHSLRRKPLNQFTPEDLRIMIGQKNALPILIPLALKELQRDPMVSGDFYAGDLLRTVVEIPYSYWLENERDFLRFKEIARSVRDKVMDEEFIPQNDYEMARRLEALLSVGKD